jgi:predicted TIM-barrel fold metal-dependent hydrolase
VVPRVLEMLGSDDMLMWASDWPHWQYEGDAALPPGLPEALLPRILRENALETYPRLLQGAMA